MAYINVDEVYILDNTGLQVDQTTDLPFKDAGLTESQQAQARKNIAAGGTNPNLLDNPWFGSGEVVNQRGATNGSTTHNAYSIDRWKMSYGNAIGTWSIGANGLTISAASGTYALFDQVLPTSLTSYISGKTLTASCLMSDGSIYSGTAVWTSGTSETFFTTASNFRLQLLNTNAFRMVCNSGASNTVRAVKLELGSVSTLANDTPPDYGTELLKCQYYYRRIPLTRYPIAIDGSYAYLTTIGMNMRTTPTAALIDTGGVRDAGGQANITSASVTGFTYNNATVRFTLASSRSYVVGYIYDTTLALSADII